MPLAWPGVLAMKDSLAWARGIELICVLLSALLAAGLLPGASPATCAAPFLFGVAVRVGYPPAGKGVGQPAPSLAEGLEVVSGSELGAADRGGEGDGDGSAGSRRTTTNSTAPTPAVCTAAHRAAQGCEPAASWRSAFAFAVPISHVLSKYT